MSATWVTYLHCDGCGEPYSVDPLPASAAEPGDTATDQRAQARAEGWLVSQPGGQDYCTDCRPGAS